jgi:hypothetical protein
VIHRLLFVTILASGLMAPTMAVAQTDAPLLGNIGLGRRIAPLDARARGLGGAATALHGPNMSAVNPAAIARFNESGVWATLMPETQTISGVLARGEVKTVAFPLLRAVLPLGERLVASVGFASYLDQDWGVQFIDTMQTLTGPIAFQETRTAKGGINQLRIDFASVISPSWGIGVTGIYYFGQTPLSVERIFQVDVGFQPYEANDALSYQGIGFAIGAEYQPFPEMIVGVTGTWGSKLRAKSDSTSSSSAYDLPIGLDIGGSWRLTPDFLVALAGAWEGWSVLNNRFQPNGVSDLLYIGLGGELTAHETDLTAFYIRVGGHLQQTPFNVAGRPPQERALGGGLGARFQGGRVLFDFAVEYGKRGNIDVNLIEESFTRLTMSAAVFSN